MTKELHVVIIKRWILKNKFLRQKNQANMDNYKIQKNIKKKNFESKKSSPEEVVEVICYLTHFRPMFHLCKKQVVGFY